MLTATDSRTMISSPSGLQHLSISFERHQGQAASRWLALPLALNLRTMRLIQISNPAVNECYFPIQVRYKKHGCIFVALRKQAIYRKDGNLIMAKEKMMGTIGQVADMDAFASIVKQMLAQAHPSADVEIQKVAKNNHRMLTGIAIYEAGNNIAPNIYLEDFFKEYQAGKPLDEICHIIEEIHKRTTPDSNFDADVITDFSAVKEKVCYKLVNAEKNAILLKETPHRLWQDLAIVYYVPVSVKSAAEVANITVSNSMMGLWGGVNEDMLYRHARINTPRLFKAKIMPVLEMMKNKLQEIETPELKMIAGMLEAELDTQIPEGTPQLYVATNDCEMNGAAVLLYDGLLEGFARRMGSNFYIFPSSIHETLFLPISSDVGEKDRSYMLEMVRGINASGEVAPEDILSDNVYFYDSKDNFLQLIR